MEVLDWMRPPAQVSPHKIFAVLGVLGPSALGLDPVGDTGMIWGTVNPGWVRVEALNPRCMYVQRSALAYGKVNQEEKPISSQTPRPRTEHDISREVCDVISRGPH